MALSTIASVAVVIWTGGFIVKGWMQRASLTLMAGMNYLQFAFFGSIMALLANAVTLRCLAVAFFIYYASFFVRLATRHPAQLFQLVPITITFLWPDPRVLAWCCAAMTFLGYRIILEFVYNDLQSEG